MATVHYDRDCRDGFEDSDSGYDDPLAVADTEHSDVARAEFELSTPMPRQQRWQSPPVLPPSGGASLLPLQLPR